MCRAKNTPNYRRCFGHQYTARINTLKARIAQKQAELESIRAIKVKHAEVMKRLRAAEQQLAKKKTQLAEQEAKLAELKPELKPQDEKPELIERVETLTAAVETTRVEIDEIKSEIRKLQAELRANPNFFKKDALTRRERDLTDLLNKKREDLRVLEAEAEEAKKKADAEKAEVKAESDETDDEGAADAAATYTPYTRGDEGAQLRTLLTASEVESIRSKLGNHENLGHYVLRQALTGVPTFNDMEATDYDETRFKRKGVVGRPATVAGETREHSINFREEVADRAIVRTIAASIAEDYGLDVNNYLRRRALGLDLLSIERDKSVQHNRDRIAKIAREEEEAGVSKAIDRRAFREARYQASYEKAVRAAEERFGKSKVSTALYLNTNPYTAKQEDLTAQAA